VEGNELEQPSSDPRASFAARQLNLAVLGAVLWADLGTKEITWRRVLRPVLVAAIAIAIFVKSPQTAGNGLTLELVGLVAGLALGAVGSLLLMVIRRDPGTKKLVSEAGAACAAFWIVVIGLRLLFTYGANHWYNHALGKWLFTNPGALLLPVGAASVFRRDQRNAQSAAVAG